MMKVIASHPAPAGLLGQVAVPLAGAAGVALIALIGIRLAASEPVPPRRPGPAAAAAGSLAAARAGLARRAHPVIAAGTALTAGLAATLIVTCALGLLAKTGMITRLDRPIDSYVDGHRIPAVTSVMVRATTLGSYTVAYTVAAAGGLLIGLAWRRWLPLLALLAAVPVEDLGQKLTGILVHGPRPARALAIGSPGGFFSGGSARVVLVCGLLAFFLGWFGLGRRQRAAGWTCVALAAFIEGYSRLYLGRHFAVDIIGGWAAGALLLASFAFAAQALRPVPAPAAQPPATSAMAGMQQVRTGPRARAGPKATRV